MAKSTTQDFLEFDQIREGIVILKNKGLRVILMVSSLNFALKSTETQNAIMYQYQNFLNSLDFSLQILVHSRRLNMTGYFDKLEDIEQAEENELLKLQIAEYRKFTENLIKGGSIMQKTFYVIVPFSFLETKGKKGRERFLKITLTEEKFKRARTQLMQRVAFVILGLRGCGLQAAPLSSVELIELFWSLHHPTEAERGYYPEIPQELIK